MLQGGSNLFSINTEVPFLVNQQMSKAIIYIEETNSMADVTFPSVPRVVSLLHYDDIDRSRDSPLIPGYPVICVTVSDSTTRIK